MFDPDDFSTDFELATDPPPEEAEGGPWVSHGVVHIGHPPLHH